MRSLNLDQLRALLEVVEHKSFSAAARRLNLTQPAISLQIRELERRFGVRLIERLGKQAHATAPGRDLIAAAQRILAECERADEVMRRYRDGWVGRIIIGTTLTALIYALPPILRRLSEAHPGIELHVTNLPTRESVERILASEIDLALVTLPVDERQLDITPLSEERLVAIFSRSVRDLPDRVTPDYAASRRLLMEHTSGAVHGLVSGWLSRERARPRAPMYLGTIEALKSAVASNLGMSIVPEMAVSGRDSEIVFRPLDPPLTRTLALIEHHSKPNEPALAIVRTALLTLRDGSLARAGTPRGPAGRPTARAAASRPRKLSDA